MKESQKPHPTWETLISLPGIEQAIQALGYRSRRSMKFRLVDTLRAFHEQEGKAAFEKGFDSDDLIRVLWDTGKDPFSPASKRRNLTSLRSSVNADLMSLYRKGENPEGVIISPENTFIPCEEAKNQTLEALKGLSGDGDGSLDAKRIGALLRGLQELLSQARETHPGEMKMEAAGFDEIQSAVRGLAKDLELGPAQEEGKGVLPSGAGDGGLEEDLFEEEEPADETCEDVEAVEEEAEEDLEEVDVPEDAEIVEEEEGEEEAYEDVEAMEDEAGEDLEEVDVPEDAEIVEEEEGEEAAYEDVGAVEDEAEEDLEEADVPEDAEIVEEEGDDSDEEAEAFETGAGEDESVLDGWDFLDEEPEGAREDPERRQILAEEFNASLAAMDRFFNAYILIPEGDYPGVDSDSSAEGVEKRVRLPAFYIGRFPVTNALFEVFVEKTGYTTTAEKEGYGTVYQGRYRCVKDERTGKQTLYGSSGVVSRRIRGACWYQPTGPGSTLRGKRNRPVVQITLEDAMAFAAWTGKRLPTEQEWEAAMRMEQGLLYPWGNEWKEDACNVEAAGIGEPSNVDRFVTHANGLGISDGLGNVLEWTLTPAREREETLRMVRGASWIAGKEVSLLSGSALPPKARSNLLGFRCVAY